MKMSKQIVYKLKWIKCKGTRTGRAINHSTFGPNLFINQSLIYTSQKSAK